MANSKHISEDEIKYIVDVESSKAQQEIRKLEKSSASLRSENKRRLDQMVKLEAQGKKESQLYKDLRQNYNQVNKQIRENTTQIANLTKEPSLCDTLVRGRILSGGAPPVHLRSALSCGLLLCTGGCFDVCVSHPPAIRQSASHDTRPLRCSWWEINSCPQCIAKR